MKADRYVVGYPEWGSRIYGPNEWDDGITPFRSLKSAGRNAKRHKAKGNAPIIYRLVPVRCVRAKAKRGERTG